MCMGFVVSNFFVLNVEHVFGKIITIFINL